MHLFIFFFTIYGVNVLFYSMNSLYKFFIFIFTVPVFLIGSQFAQIGDNVSLTLDTSASYSNKSNIYKSTTEISDDVFIFSPGVLFNVGAPEAGMDMSLKLSYQFLRYASLDQLDTDLFSSYFNSQFRGSSTNVILNYNFIERQSAQSSLLGRQVSPLDETLIETESDNVNLLISYNYSPKLSLSTGYQLDKLDYSTYSLEYASKENVTIPLNLTYKYSQKLGIVYGVEFTEREVGDRFDPDTGDLTRSGYTSDDVFYKIGLNGQLLPKLSGTFNVGYRTVEFSDDRADGNKDTWAMNSRLLWKVTPKLSTNFVLRRNLDSAGSGDSYNTTNISVGNNYKLNTEFSLSLNGDFAFKEYVENKNRTDESNTYSLRLNYLPISNLVLSGTFSFLDNRSHTFKYKSRDFTLSANFKY